MTPESSEQKIRQLLPSIVSKRARVVIEHILERGYITTEELRKIGYDHPPRAARDVREAGIPLETFRVQSSEGRRIAAYRLGDLTKIREGRFRGRRAFPRILKRGLYEASDGKCAICSGAFEARYLQVDHRIPYEVTGDVSESEWHANSYMMLCGPCNRAKSWSCEHCINWSDDKLPQVCLACYWANPEGFTHIALREVRRIDILWGEDEVEAYERLKQAAQERQIPIPEYVKNIIAKHLGES